jgi:hypothetical protein
MQQLSTEPVDVAVLDLHGAGYHLAPDLAARGIPFLFITGGSPSAIPPEFQDRPALVKPFAVTEVLGLLGHLASRVLARNA